MGLTKQFGIECEIASKSIYNATRVIHYPEGGGLANIIGIQQKSQLMTQSRHLQFLPKKFISLVTYYENCFRVFLSLSRTG